MVPAEIVKALLISGSAVYEDVMYYKYTCVCIFYATL
jgi:hypothetical protein